LKNGREFYLKNFAGVEVMAEAEVKSLAAG